MFARHLWPQQLFLEDQVSGVLSETAAQRYKERTWKISKEDVRHGRFCAPYLSKFSQEFREEEIDETDDNWARLLADKQQQAFGDDKSC